MASEYTLGKKMGSGAFGIVYEASRKCALKSIDISNQEESLIQEKKIEWKKEVEALMAVRGHDNIVEYRNSFASIDNKLWVEMEFCSGGTFNDYVLEKQPTRSLKHQFMVEISSAVAFLHTRGIVHRDLKPENIMIAYDDEYQPHAKVGDFGLAKAISSCTLYGDVKKYYLKSRGGTALFMAPEVFDGKYTEKADIFSMGIIFFCIVPENFSRRMEGKLYLAVDYEGEAYGSYMRQEGKNMFYTDTYAGQIGTNIRNLIESMVRKDYHQRPSAEEVNSALKTIPPKEISILAPAPAATPF